MSSSSSSSSSPSSNSNNKNIASPNPFDSVLLNSLMEKLQIGPSSTAAKSLPSSSSSLDEILAELDLIQESDDGDDSPKQSVEERHKARLLEEERNLEHELITLIHRGQTQSLNVNSGQAVTLNNHYVCVCCHIDRDGEYRVWEWHGHILLFNEKAEFSPEYFYGNYFERLDTPSFDLHYKENGFVVEVEEEPENDVSPPLDLGLRGLISGINCTNGNRIVHRNVSADSQSFL